MKSYDHSAIEKKWQDKWEKDELYHTPDAAEGKENRYVLVEFPYPSGDLHIGHWYAFAVPDIYARYLTMLGHNVLYPIGFDSFGLPAENAAIKRGLDPRKWTYDNIDTMSEQLKSMGNTFDWSRKVVTSDPEYYKWTQWLFLQLFAREIAYKKLCTVNWCDSCKTVLANEQIVNGECERCGGAIAKKVLDQWYFWITKYADRLLEDLDELDWPQEIKDAQREWIGKSNGAALTFAVKDADDAIEVFTTRPDTLYGATYMVLAPEHPYVAKWKDRILNWDEVDAYMQATTRKKELDRKEAKEKTGVELKGVMAINPATKEEIPIWIADYVLATYGTGAVMAVPAHDERDFAFAQTFGLPIREVVREVVGTPLPDAHNTDAVFGVVRKKGSKKILVQYNPLTKLYRLPGGTIEKSDADERETLAREIHEEVGLEGVTVGDYVAQVYAHFSPPQKDENWTRTVSLYEVDATDAKEVATQRTKDEEQLEHMWLTPDEAVRKFDQNPVEYGEGALLKRYVQNTCFTGAGETINSGDFSGQKTEEAKTAITEHVGGELTVQYRLRDWLLSRQRYWGCPIPIVYDPEGKAHPVPDEHLPWTLPDDVDFTPTGEAPLAKSNELKERTEKLFGKGWTPEVDTMDTFVDSSWYFLRYLDPHNDTEFSPKDKQEKWMPVDRYSGGAEHTTMHLLYSRFFHKALFDLGLVTSKEPYSTRMSRGLILGPDGAKMSKSKGNVINPDEHVARVGADTVKMYLAFIGPFNEVGQYPWDLGGIAGIRRFLERVWGLQDAVSDVLDSDEIQLLVHQTVQKVGDDVAAFKFNTAISATMILVNALEKEDAVSKQTYETLVCILAPFAPHQTEELWQRLGHETSIHLEDWPSYDEQRIAQASVTIAVQVNGKTRGTFTAAPDSDKEELIAAAKALDNVASHLEGVSIKREIVVPDRLINFVVI